MMRLVVAVTLLRRRASWDPATPVVVVALLLRGGSITVVALVTGVAKGVATHGSEGTTNGGTFKSAMALRADNTADGSTAESSQHRTRLRIGA